VIAETEAPSPLIPYLRVSRLGGRSGESFISLDEQKRQILRYCGDEIALTDWYSDPDFSGKNTKRPAFQRGLQAITAGEASGMIVCKLDRFARSVIDALTTPSKSRPAADVSSRPRRGSTSAPRRGRCSSPSSQRSPSSSSPG
jgi:hypothetical protein